MEALKKQIDELKNITNQIDNVVNNSLNHQYDIVKAQKRLDSFLNCLGKPVSVHIHDDKLLYIEFESGMNLSLSENEINHQAREYDVENEIIDVKTAQSLSNYLYHIINAINNIEENLK